MSLVKEQGATRWVRPSDYARDWAPNPREPYIPQRVRKAPNIVPRVKTPFPGRKVPSLPVPRVPAGATRGLGAALRLGRVIAPRALGVAGLLWPIIDVLNNPNKMWRPNPLNGWRKCWGDCPITPNHSSKVSSCTAVYQKCLSGQAIGTGGPNGILAPLATDTSFTLSQGVYNTSIAAWRHTLHSLYVRPSTAVNVSPALVPATDPFIPISPEANPNVIRWSPSLRPGTAPTNPWRWNVPDPKIEVGVGEVLDRMDALADQSFEVSGNPAPIIRNRPGTDTVPRPRDREQPPARPKPPHVRQKPPRNTKEKKVRGPVYLFFAIADAISEAAEVVDALFEALPEDVQKRWYRDRKISGADKYRHPLIDQAGQYGIDGADWKMQAVFHNFHKIDIEKAIKNIVANQIEDKLIGSLHRNLPRNFINANEDGQKAYAKLVSKLLVELGLKEPEDER